MKNFILAALLLIGLSAPALAQYDRDPNTDRVGYVNTVSTEKDIAILTTPAYVYAVTLLNTTNPIGYALIYDAAATPGNGVRPKVEIGELGQAASGNRVVYNPPLKFDTGVYVDTTNASVVIEYR